MTRKFDYQKQNTQKTPIIRTSNDESLIANYYKSHDKGYVGPEDPAGNQLMERVTSILRGFSFSIPGLKFSGEIEDSIQDVGLAIANSVSKRKNRFNKRKSKLHTWAIGILKHKEIDALRKDQRHEVKIERYKEHLKTQNLNTPSPFDELIAAETYDKMLEKIKNAKVKEPEKNRLVFVFESWIAENLNVKEISVKGGMKKGQVYRDKRKLKKILADYNPK